MSSNTATQALPKKSSSHFGAAGSAGSATIRRRHGTMPLLAVIEVGPKDQKNLSLGKFTAENPPKGFAVELTPDPDPAGSTTTQVISTGTPEHYELTLHIANHGDRSLVATVSAL